MVNFKRKALLVGMGMALSGAVYAGGGMVAPIHQGSSWYVQGQLGGDVSKSKRLDVPENVYELESKTEFIPGGGGTTYIVRYTLTEPLAMRSALTGLVGRLSLGFQATRMLSIELGVSKLASLNRTLSGRLDVVYNDATQEHTVLESSKARFFAVDLMAKLTIPMDRFFVYGAAGVAWVHAKYDALQASAWNLTVVEPQYPDTYQDIIASTTDGWASATKHHFRPRFEGGLGINLTDRIAVTAAYAAILGNNKSIATRDYLPTFNMVMGGIKLNF